MKKIALLAVLILSFEGYAKDLGSVGPVYPIQEDDVLVWLQHRLADMEKQGTLQLLQSKLQQQALKTAMEPVPVRGLTPATQSRTVYLDPSIRLPRDVYDAKGRLLYSAGTTVNPLQLVSLSKALLFIDGDNPREIAWAEKRDKQLQGKAYVILVKGNIKTVSTHWSKALYFDQAGRLTEHFHIQHTPASVTQAGLRLRIDEVALK